MEKTNELGLITNRILGTDQLVVSSTWLKENKLPLYLRNVHPIIFLVNDNQYIMLQQILPKTSYNEIECAREFVLTFQTQSITSSWLGAWEYMAGAWQRMVIFSGAWRHMAAHTWQRMVALGWTKQRVD